MADAYLDQTDWLGDDVPFAAISQPRAPGIAGADRGAGLRCGSDRSMRVTSNRTAENSL